MKFKIVFFVIFLSFSCEDTIPLEHLEWQKKRKEDLFADDGYLNIAGLFPIQNGTYSMGSKEGSDIKLPREMPLSLAEVIVKDSIISFNFFSTVILNDSTEARNISYNYFKNKNYFSKENFVWFVHLDSGVKAIRLRDLKHPLLKMDLEIDFFPYYSSNIISGKFQKYQQPKVVNFSNFLGGIFIDTIPGKINFKYRGINYSLEPTISPSGNFFIAFGDKTNGKETYGGGRYLYVMPEDSLGNVTIDFNKSLNPPCVFSTFTTCPVPRSENIMNVKIEAGEKNYDGLLFSSVYQ